MRLRIDLAYDGGGFFGWAKQPTIRTVQGEIERVLHTITRVPVDDPAEPLRLTVAGRTDTGVHASHQVCHLDIGEETLSPLRRAHERAADRSAQAPSATHAARGHHHP